MLLGVYVRRFLGLNFPMSVGEVCGSLCPYVGMSVGLLVPRSVGLLVFRFLDL